jgi:hypothetical protein
MLGIMLGGTLRLRRVAARRLRLACSLAEQAVEQAAEQPERVAVMWDLDNVRPQVYGRRELAALVSPILDTARALGSLGDGY